MHEFWDVCALRQHVRKCKVATISTKKKHSKKRKKESKEECREKSEE